MITCSKGLPSSFKIVRSRLSSSFWVATLASPMAIEAMSPEGVENRLMISVSNPATGLRSAVFSPASFSVWTLATGLGGGRCSEIWPSTGDGLKVRMKNASNWKAISSMAARLSSTSFCLRRRLPMLGLPLRLAVHGLQRKPPEAVFLADLDHPVEQVKRRGPIGTHDDDRPQVVVRFVSLVGAVVAHGQPAHLRLGGDIAIDVFVDAKDLQVALGIDVQNEQVL